MSKYRNTQHPHVVILVTHLNVQCFSANHSIRHNYEEIEERKTIKNPHILLVRFILASSNSLIDINSNQY